MNTAVTKLFLGAVAALLFAGTVAAQDQGTPVFREDFSRPLSAEWKPFKFSTPTDYHTGLDGTNPCLIAHSPGTASGIAHAVKVKPPGRLILTWRWKIDRCPPGGTETNLATFDHTARVFVGFKAFLGPPRSINYVWACQTPVGATFLHPNSGRARFVTLESGNAKAGQWVTESRDVTADWHRLFPEMDLPAPTAVGVITDSDGTGAEVNGWYANLELREE
jgi:Protein of unknown function (DUF3047)